MIDLETAKKLKGKVVTLEIGPHRKKIRQCRVDSITKDGVLIFLSVFDCPLQYVLASDIKAYTPYKPTERIECK